MSGRHLDGVRLLRAVSQALDGPRLRAGLIAAARAIAPGFADGCVIRSGDGTGELYTAGMVVPPAEMAPLDIPLVHRGEPYGSLLLVRRGEGFDDDDRVLAEECAARIAAAHDGARMREAATTAILYDGFLATLSHELRTPLNVIAGWIDLLRGERLTADKRAQALEIVERNAKVQIRLIEDILDASRIVTGKLRLELASVPAVDLVVGAVEALRPQAEAARVALDVTTGPAFTLRGDGVRLGQVVHNLVGNALRFTPPGGHIAVSLARDGDQAVLAVSDDGGGIDPSFLPHVFERFRQGERKRVGGSRGLGLGLFIVRHIVEAHGGTVAAHSDGRGRGARFTVSLPLPRPGE